MALFPILYKTGPPKRSSAVLQKHQQRCHAKIANGPPLYLLACKMSYRALLKIAIFLCLGLPIPRLLFIYSKPLVHHHHNTLLLVEHPPRYRSSWGPSKSAAEDVQCRQKSHAAASEMRPLDRVLTSLASLRVGRCTAVQLGRTCDTSACPQSGSPSACTTTSIRHAILCR